MSQSLSSFLENLPVKKESYFQRAKKCHLDCEHLATLCSLQDWSTGSKLLQVLIKTKMRCSRHHDDNSNI